MANDYHRLESTTQTKATAILQCNSGEIWGATPQGGNWPTVQAYRNRLPAGARGIDISTNTSPTPGRGSRYEARWYYGLPNPTPGVFLQQLNGIDYAAIKATVINHQT